MSLKVIPPDREADILARAGAGEGTESIAAWLSGELGRKINGRRVREFLERCRAERAPIARAVIAEKLGRTLTADLDAVDGILERARKDELAAGKHDDVLRELERLALVDIAKAFDSAGRLLPLKEIPEDVRRCIAAIDVETVDADQAIGMPERMARQRLGALDDGAERPLLVAKITKVKFWDKVRGLELLAKARSRLTTREMALKARDQQLRALALRLELSGAGQGGDVEKVETVRARLLEKLNAAMAAKD